MKKKEKIKGTRKSPAIINNSGKGSSKRIKAKERVWDNASILDALVNNSSEVHLLFDMNRSLQYVSPSFETLTGYKATSLGKKQFIHYFHPEDNDRMLKVWDAVFHGKEYNGQFRIIIKHKAVKWCSASWKPVRDRRGRQIGVLLNGEDITDFKMNEKTLPESEAKYGTILETMEEGLYEIDLRGNYTFVNDAGCRQMGYTCDELTGMNYRNISTPETSLKLYEIFHRIYETGKPEFLMDYDVIRKDGSVRTHQSNAALMKNRSGQPIGFFNLARDVTERKKKVDQHRLREERYRNILDTMEESYFEVDLKGNLIFFNATVIRRLGYTNEETTGMNFRKFMDKENAKKVLKAFNQIFLTGESNKAFDWDIINKQGEKIAIESSIILRKDERGEPVGFRGVVRDITKRREAEEALRQSEEKYRTILETMEEGFFESDLTGTVTFANDAACKLIGYEREELIGLDYHKIYAPDIVKDVFKIYNNIYKTGEPALFLDYKVIRKDESIRVHEATASLRRNHSGEAIGFRVLVRDVTERRKAEDALRQKEEALRQSEEKYRIIAENVYDVIWTVDLDETVTYVSPSISVITGYTPEEIQNKPVKDIITLESYALVEKMLAEELAKEKTPADPRGSRTLELELIQKNGSTAWVEASATFIRDEHLHVEGILGVARDISERKQAEKEKTRLEEQLVQAQKMESVGRLAGGVAHDFNNMLSVILGYVDLIKLNLPQSDSLFKDVLEIERAASRSRDITRELLAFSRKQIITPMPLDLNLLIDSTTMTLSRLIGEDIDCRFYPGNDLWNIKFDPSQVEQILVNLAANARDAMPYGGKLTIETENTYLNEDYCSAHIGFTSGYYVLLGVSDNGVGMNKETLQHAFEPFYTTKETGRGTGLGLSTVYGIVKQNGGFINIYSEPGKGTAFKIYIPRSMEEGAAPEESETAILVTGSGTVLLVEDDEMVRNMITEMLEAIGYTVQATGNPVDALSMIQKNNSNIDLMLTDVVMPGMSGKELRERIEIVRPGIRVLFMSGYSSNVIAHHGVLDEGVHFIQKPFSMIDLARKVRDAIKDK